MRKYTENSIIFNPGEHKIILPYSTKIIGYKPLFEVTEDSYNIIEDGNYLDYIIHYIYENMEEVIVPKNNPNTPGIPKETYEREKHDIVIMAPYTHEIYMPSSYQSSLNDIYEMVDDIDTIYKLYRNKVEVAVLLKDLEENILGKRLVKM